jgi:flagellar biosynthetic protein FliS
MHGAQAYQQQQRTTPTRIELILTLYDGAIERLQRARQLLTPQPDEARQLIAQCQMIVSGLAGGMDPAAGDVAVNFLRLYEYVAHCLAQGTDEGLAHAISVLTTLREGFQEIRPQALEMERSGVIPPLRDSHLLQATVC